MPIGAITGYIDVAQLVLYAFWIFFAGLIIYLRQEDKREGYPLEDPATPIGQAGRREMGFPPPPKPKEFRLADGSVRYAPREEPLDDIKAEPLERWPGAPLVPTGNPMLDGVGPGAYANRPDEPEKTMHGDPRLAPLRVATDYSVATEDPDPRGMAVVAADGQSPGEIVDVWIDRAEPHIRYLEVQVTATGAETEAEEAENTTGKKAPAKKKRSVQKAQTVLLPIGFARIDGEKRKVRVSSILAKHFAEVPALRNPDQVTQLEEEKIMAYYGAGHLYARPERQEPLF